MTEIAYKYINDTFNIPNFRSLIDIMTFNNGINAFYVDGTPVLRAGYGIRIKYIDKNGRCRCVTGYGNVMFFGIEDPCDVIISLGNESDISICGTTLKIRSKITVLTDNTPAQTIQKKTAK